MVRVAQGLLTDRYPGGSPDGSRVRTSRFLDESELTPARLETIRGLDETARGRGQSRAQLAPAWALRDQRVTSLIIGASGVAQLEQNLGALDHLALPDGELSAIDKLLADDRAQRPEHRLECRRDCPVLRHDLASVVDDAVREAVGHGAAVVHARHLVDVDRREGRLERGELLGGELAGPRAAAGLQAVAAVAADDEPVVDAGDAALPGERHQDVPRGDGGGTAAGGARARAAVRGAAGARRRGGTGGGSAAGAAGGAAGVPGAPGERQGDESGGCGSEWGPRRHCWISIHGCLFLRSL
ncbi:aldo/keto reductase [Dactylosporangium roseum]|uniref:Aldo/keto reductase n=1 Tax=Dactylosporangium roseum TaxID=47989 RepID=A0ABY5ZDT8_9ACTN|nr:aldo/keto reductase [Dactylosporangium roseum]